MFELCASLVRRQSGRRVLASLRLHCVAGGGLAQFDCCFDDAARSGFIIHGFVGQRLRIAICEFVLVRFLTSPWRTVASEQKQLPNF